MRWYMSYYTILFFGFIFTSYIMFFTFIKYSCADFSIDVVFILSISFRHIHSYIWTYTCLCVYWQNSPKYLFNVSCWWIYLRIHGHVITSSATSQQNGGTDTGNAKKTKSLHGQYHVFSWHVMIRHPRYAKEAFHNMHYKPFFENIR